MSQSNPYAPSFDTPSGSVDIRKVRVRPLDLMQRGYGIIADQYWLFLGITFVGILIASAVPFGLILGPMLVGIYMCYAARQRGELVEFGHVFRGFDSFKESFIATLCILAFAFVVMVPLMILMFVVVFLPILAAAEQNGGNGDLPAGSLIGFLIMYPLLIAANIVIALPFVFTFQLIADRKMDGITAVKASFQGVMTNFFGVTWYMIVLMFVSLILACMCYVPAILFLPVSFGSIFLLYREIYPQPAMTH